MYVYAYVCICMCLYIWMCAVCIVHVQDTYTNVYVQDTYTNVYRTHMHMHAYMHAYIHTLVGSGPLFPQSVLQCLCSCAAFRRICGHRCTSALCASVFCGSLTLRWPRGCTARGPLLDGSLARGCGRRHLLNGDAGMTDCCQKRPSKEAKETY